MEIFTFSPKGYFNLKNQSNYFDNCASLACSMDKTVVSFPVEGAWNHSATVVLQQPEPDKIIAEVHTEQEAAEKAFRQAIAILSLNADGTGWDKVGKKDAVIANLQKKYDFIRPTLFHSPYEAAVAFVIGNRISIKQRQVIMNGIAEKLGHKSVIDGERYYAFPSPEQLLKLQTFPGLNEIKISRLKNIAHAALDGLLNREYLRSLPSEMALTQIKNIPGIGEFYAQAILYRGAGIVNEITNDDLTPYAIQKAYELPTLPDKKTLAAITANWAPYKMWCNVLMHIWLRNEVGLPQKREFVRKEKKVEKPVKVGGR